MRSLFVIVLFFACGAFAAIPDSESGWYSPPQGWVPNVTDASWWKNGIFYLHLCAR